MYQLIKQFLKSMKSSFFLVLGIILLSSSIIFALFTTIYLNSSINDSLNSFRANSNSSHVVIDKKYNNTDPEFDYEKNSDGTPKVTIKATYTSNYKYDETNFKNNVIFPYTSDDFTKPNINATWNGTPEEQKLPYYDKYLPRYGARKAGILSASNIDYNFVARPTANRNAWRGIGFSMNNTKDNTKLFDPKNFVYNSDGRLIGYFADGTIQQLFTASQSIYRTTSNNFDLQNPPTIINQVPLFGNNIILTYTIVSNKNLDPKLNNPYVDLISAINQNKSDTEMNNFYTINLKYDSLKGIDKYIYDTIKELEKKANLSVFEKALIDKFESSIHEEIYFRKSWIDDYKIQNSIATDNEVIEIFLKNKSDQKKNNFKTFVDENRDIFIENYLQENGYAYNLNKSFSLLDKNSNINYLISMKNPNINTLYKKPNDWINKIVLNNNDSTNLENSSYYELIKYLLVQSVDSYILNNLTNPQEKTNYFLYYYKTVFSFLTKKAFSTPPNSTNAYNDYVSFKNSLEYISDNIQQSNNNFEFPVINPNLSLENLIKKITYLIDTAFYINEQNYRNIDFTFHFNTAIPFSRTTSNFSSPNYGSYQAIVTKEYLDQFGKEILPKNKWLEISNEANNKNFETNLNNLDDKYIITISDKKFIITGSGLSSEMAYPAFSLAQPIPDTKNSALVYLNKEGYESILQDNPYANEMDYFSIDTNLSKINNISTINKNLVPIMNGSTDIDSNKVCYSISDLFNSSNILSLRYSFPDILRNNISTFSLIAVVSLTIISLYLVFIILKNYINKNKVQLAIFKANGFSTIKISMALSSIGVIIALISGIIGYLLAYYMQPIIFSIIMPYMFIPYNFVSFSAFGIIMGILGILLIFGFFVFINLYFLFKKPLSIIISQNIDIKTNPLLNILKFKKINLTSNMKFKFALSISNVPRTFFYLVSCLFGVGIITFGLSFISKFYESQRLTNLNKHYTYNINFNTPNSQSGLLKLQNYVDLGFSDPSIGVDSLYPEVPSIDNPYIYAKNDLKVYEIQKDSLGNPMLDSSNNLILNQKLSSSGLPLTFSNIVLPSYELYVDFNKNLDIFRNAVFSKWLLDFEIPIFKINIWDQVKNNFPQEFIKQIEKENQNFLHAIYNYKIPQVGIEFQKFITPKNITPTTQIKLDGSKILTKKQIGTSNVDSLSDEFLKFVGLVYGIEELAKQDIKLSYGILGMDTDPKASETYTYLNGNFFNPNSNENNDKEFQIWGIKPNSEFINLKDNNGIFIGDKLNQNDKSSKINSNLNTKIYNIIINNGASLKYNLGIGSKFKIKISNSYFNSFQNFVNNYVVHPSIPNDKNNFNNVYEFRVVDIASTSFGEEFFVSQENANEILGLNKGEYVNNIQKQADGSYVVNTTANKNNEGFNGVLSKENNPIILSKSLSYYSNYNLYGTSLTLGAFKNLINNNNKNLIEKAFEPRQNAIDFYKDSVPILNNYKIEDFNTIFSSFSSSNELVINYILNVLGDNPISIALNNIGNYTISQDIYSILTTTLNLVQILLISIIIPIVIFIILIMSSIMMQEIQKMILVFKTMGYSDKKNIFNIIFNFFPIYVVSVLLGLLFVFLLFLTSQHLIYFISSIYISTFINFANFAYAALAILAVILFNILITIFLYKRTKLNESINY